MRLLGAAVAAAVLLVACAAAAPLGQWTAGTAVPYGGPSDGQDPHQASGGLKSGSCGYGELSQSEWPYWSAVAVSSSFPLAANTTRHPLLGCGACIELQCSDSRCPAGANGSSLVALITDTCVDCPANKLTLHYLSFAQKLASPDIGEVGIQWRQVECDAPAPIVADIDTYRATQGGYIRLSLESVAGTGGIASIELRKSPLAGDRMSLAGTTWARMTNSWGAKYELSGLADTPLDVRITSDSGEVLVARQAIKDAGVTGKLALPVQFSAAGTPGIADAESNATIVPTTESVPCNATVVDLLRARPDMGKLMGYLQSSGILPLLEDPAAAITLFAPTDDAWARVDTARVDLSDRETLQAVLTFLVAQGQVVMPDPSQMLPEDLATGGVLLTMDTLNGAPLQVFASPQGIALRDGSSLTPDSIIVSANNMACSSVVDVVTAAVPMPF
ncbi:hypothetical protein ABPG75_000478 [Micractinium tetrahymenae]